jgi:hypothetical protein
MKWAGFARWKRGDARKGREGYSMGTRRIGSWWFSSVAVVLWATSAFSNDSMERSPQPIAADSGELRISVGSDVSSLSGEDLRAAARNLVAPLLSAGLHATSAILVDAESGADIQTFAIADLQ